LVPSGIKASYSHVSASAHLPKSIHTSVSTEAHS
jgi:hypothetical protein